MIVGIVGSEESKFTIGKMIEAKRVIRDILGESGVVGVSSGHCHLGGIDIWAEEIGRGLGLGMYIYPPQVQRWEGGYKDRNILIAHASDIVHVITLKELPVGYRGMRFTGCYHCGTTDHVKSGGCWTAKYAQRIGKQAKWHII